MSDPAPAPRLDPLLLTQLLCTRLCHDLAGPVGAVAAGVELTASDPTQIDQETLSLIGNSSAAASRKLKFLRAALGIPSAPTNLRALIEGFLGATAGHSGPPALIWPAAAEVEALGSHLAAHATPLLLNLCLMVLEALPQCRRLEVDLSQA